MGLFDFFRNNQRKNKAKSHIKNLIDMALADGHFDMAEYELLLIIARRHGISENQVKRVRKHPEEIQFLIPADDKKRFFQLYDLVNMMIIDGEVHNLEFKLCKLFAEKFGYATEQLDYLINATAENIKMGNNHEETYQRVISLINTY
ncbi:MAG: hypothetical protein AAF734_06360 [Bacteroidota bacterium]